jgi:ribosomal protein S18 acetylase RimI-like enzyme
MLSRSGPLRVPWSPRGISEKLIQATTLHRLSTSRPALRALTRLDDEGVTPTQETQRSKEDIELHKEKIRNFIVDQDKGAFIYEDAESMEKIGVVMYSLSNCDSEYPWKTIYKELDRTLFQSDARFIEVFQLWVHPSYRRKGIATKLKLQLEEVAKSLGVNLIYTHTEEQNTHVIHLNEKLGYREVRRGPIWDEIIRVSLIKHVRL